ncbi:hypothetical protein THRCLA_03340 [Thraustotheca clavata]|uniref:ATP-dependent (S)-NAD(P)H-hydrate dehydratase n=1 Tax=Thraustotheca clavata TaxID=74557 RepID=A0A1W0A2E7_9STRA|nr:hypothetical protein THRCLA_03340 [Thraustotheca clavata]
MAAQLDRTLVRAIRQAIPSLSNDFHKGQYGKIGIVGGSLEYTGAPYYAGISALKTVRGVDLCHIFCTKEAAIPIKCYSPELIVHPLLTQDTNAIMKINEVLPRLDALVLGPGLGREPFVLDLVKKVVESAKAMQLPMVLDGDALYLLSTDTSLIHGYVHTILTPNIVEYGRLCVATGLMEKLDIHKARLIPPAQLSQSLGNVTVLQKGKQDSVSDGTTTLTNTIEGCPRRCGGQGDVLAGTVGSFLAWHQCQSKLKNQVNEALINPLLVVALGGSMLTRQSAAMAFAEKKRSMTTPDLIQHLGEAFIHLYEN